jgi:GNAT superfamily N-acetyltransferase
MEWNWIREEAPAWDESKQRIVGEAPVGTFDRRYAECRLGDPVPGDWWRAEADGRTVGYGWLDLVWGDAEILLGTDPAFRRRGVGSFILERLEGEARRMGVNYVYNTVRPTHPDREAVTEWLKKRGFRASEDGSLLRAATRAE